MALDLDKLPDLNPTGLPAPGFYLFKITKAVMTIPRDVSKKEYISLVFALTNSKGMKVGNLFDRITESTHQISLYKLKRLFMAVGLNLSGTLSLRDIAKVLINREGVLELTHNLKDPAYPKAEVKVFGSECFWPSSEFKNLITESVPEQTDLPFTMEETTVAEEVVESDDDVQKIIDSVENDY